MSENYTKGAVPQFRINIDNLIYQKVMHWVNKATGEVSGLGKLTIDKDTGLIEIKSAILLKQENTGTSTDIDGAAIAKAMYETRNDEGHLNWWWHSHVDFGVFWSGTDMDTIRDIGNQGFVVATVFNKKQEMLSAMYRKGDDFFPETFIDGIDTQIIEYIDKDKIDEWDKDFETKCKNRTYASYQNEYNKTWNSETGTWDYGVGEDEPTYREPQYDENFEQIADKDEAKIFAIETELESLGLQLEKQTQEKYAKSILYKICSKVDRLNISNKLRTYELKKPYFHIFNMNFPNSSLFNKSIG